MQGLVFDNYRPPSIGSEQGTAFIAHDNLLGFGDRAYFEYNITEGLNRFDVRYSIPVNARDGTFSIEYESYDSRIIDNRVRRFDIRSETESFYVNYRQPIWQTPASEFALGIGFDVRRNQTFIFNDRPFAFSFGADDREFQKLQRFAFFKIGLVGVAIRF